jgi:uncharacterized protein with PQ loop repeat
VEENHLSETWQHISAFGTIVFACIIGKGLFTQGWIIWKKKSAKCVSPLWNLYGVVLGLQSLFYGIREGYFPLIFNSTLVLSGSLLINTGIFKFRGFTPPEYLFAGLILSFALIPLWQTEYITIFFAGSVILELIICLHPPWKIWKEKSSGVVHGKLFLIFAGNTLFWSIYGWTVSDLILMITSPISCFENIGTYLLWRYYHEREHEKGQNSPHVSQ